MLEAFTDKFVAAVKTLSVGDGLQQGVSVGPLINSQALEDVANLVNDSIDQGAVLALGGQRHEAGENFYQPTILTSVTNTMAVARNEIFGPVTPIIAFDDEEDAIKMANDTEYGLAAYFFSRDIGRIWRVAEGLEYGMVGINEGILSNAAAPFGGVKQSGNGREGSKYGLADYLTIKYLCMGGLAR